MGDAHYLPQPPLPKVPGRGGEGLARRPRGRSAAGRLFPRRLHPAGRDRPDRLPEQGGGLRPAVPHGGRDAAHDRRRSQAPRRPHRRHRRAPQLGLGDDPPSACPHDRAGRRDIARRHALGVAAGPASCCRCGCSPACSGGSSWPASPTPTRRAGWRSSARSRACVAARPSPRISRRCGGRTGSSTPSRPSPGPRRCSPISPATPTASPSRTAACSPSTSAASPSATRTTAATGRRGTAR